MKKLLIIFCVMLYAGMQAQTFDFSDCDTQCINVPETEALDEACLAILPISFRETIAAHSYDIIETSSVTTMTFDVYEGPMRRLVGLKGIAGSDINDRREFIAGLYNTSYKFFEFKLYDTTGSQVACVSSFVPVTESVQRVFNVHIDPTWRGDFTYIFKSGLGNKVCTSETSNVITFK